MDKLELAILSDVFVYRRVVDLKLPNSVNPTRPRKLR